MTIWNAARRGLPDDESAAGAGVWVVMPLLYLSLPLVIAAMVVRLAGVALAAIGLTVAGLLERPIARWRRACRVVYEATRRP